MQLKLLLGACQIQIIYLPVFDLHEITDKAIGSTTLYKVLLRGEELFTRLWTKLMLKVLKQCTFTMFLDLVK